MDLRSAQVPRRSLSRVSGVASGCCTALRERAPCRAVGGAGRASCAGGLFGPLLSPFVPFSSCQAVGAAAPGGPLGVI